ncbi:redoxin domain-containing protein [Streptomyces sp. MUM 2J]|uniref:redoxin domain-containing protein n=1 Tax=Streptomyces sp. MUM 2J TaxID=2791987 RepID=UPI0027E5ACC2|nr:redoxin domain-containing protein [Streptomyces sp. MUM 2J]MCH0561816.1 redoxin domain-containing protein [Streptomyces sp. MUM 2J]
MSSGGTTAPENRLPATNTLVEHPEGCAVSRAHTGAERSRPYPVGLPLVGDTAPDFGAQVNPRSRPAGRPRRPVFFSRPADFTPVCTTECVALTEPAAAFDARDAALPGNSAGSVHSHLAWTRGAEGPTAPGRRHLRTARTSASRAVRLLPSARVTGRVTVSARRMSA